MLFRSNEKISTPVIILTAREEEIDKIIGFDLGADDYITKPFKLKELFARIKANIRRSSSYSGTVVSDENIITIQSITIDLEKHKIEKNNNIIELSKLEYDLLAFLAKNPEKIFSREELLKNVWKYDDFYGDPRTVDVTVKRLRDKIEDDSANSKIIRNKRGMGYYLTKEE